jgi:hypothetical protein
MSYDLRLWSSVHPDWRSVLPTKEGWVVSSDSIGLQRANWQIVIGPTQAVQEEDIPAGVMAELPGIRWLTEINLEPVHAPASAFKTLQSIANRAALAFHGLVEDPQEGSFSMPRGVKRFQPGRVEDRISVLNFGWWFNESPITGREGLRVLMAALKKYLPEALPRRYGPHEPPQYLFADMGEDHFLDFLDEGNQLAVWYAHYPVVGVYPGLKGEFGPQRMGYKARYFQVQVYAAVLAQPGWALGLRRFWYALSDIIQPFYGEIRRLENFILNRKRIFIDGKTDAHPVRNGWWNGIPSQLPLAVVIGAPYAALWPRFIERAEIRSGLHFAAVEDWDTDASVQRLVGRVPKNLKQGKYANPLIRRYKIAYPRTWPFEGPYAG